MILQVITGISEALTDTFGDGYTIYVEDVDPKVKPCFYISTLSNSIKQVVGNRYQMNHQFDIQYFSLQNTNVDRLQVAEKLYETLEFIQYDTNMMHGTSMSYQIVDGVLHFNISYNLSTYKEAISGDPMVVIEAHTKVE